MILADTSIWIELLKGSPGEKISADDLLRLVTCGPVVQEVLQRFRAGAFYDGFRESFLALPVLSDPLPLKTFLAAAEIYRDGRRKGYMIRSSTDCLIAAISIEHRVPVWHRDRDFQSIAKYTPLTAIESL